MTGSTKQALEQQPQAAGRGIVRIAKKLGEWVVQGAASGVVREVMRYALDLWGPV
ncbi:hypothetical protein ACFXGT_37480 [Streptomyces sp. NPDC059352]|uniref:hypothetical protein n=1 Tax=Streptomyces sp. NPDC059352 TaxID=3346810 RepID=UPI0036AC5EFA